MLCGVQHSVIMADFIMPETQQHTIVIILIIYSVYLLKNPVELKEYISGRIASYLFQFLVMGDTGTQVLNTSVRAHKLLVPSTGNRTDYVRYHNHTHLTLIFVNII